MNVTAPNKNNNNINLPVPPIIEQQERQPPQFDSTFATDSNFYFYNIIDPSTASLTTRILGPNLTTTFTHSRALSILTPDKILANLTKKTTGFLALITPGSRTREIVAWAESGHGYGPRGDLLDEKPSILSNNLWAKRAMSMSVILGLSLSHPYDRLTRGGKEGIFYASHVEFKLATHAIYTILRMFTITSTSQESITRDHLEKLRTTTWQDGSRPLFEIYFSKKNCAMCAMYVRKLGDITGVQIDLFWKDRLMKMDYQAARMGQPQSRSAEGASMAEDDGNIVAMEAVDLTEEVQVAAPESTRARPLQPMGMYLDGLAYCVGQRSRERAAGAIVELAGIRNQQSRTGRARTPMRETREPNRLATPPPSRRRGSRARR